MAAINSKQNSPKPRASTSNGSQHIVRENGHWAIKSDGNIRGSFSTQAEAIDAAKRIAKSNSEIVVHGVTGRVNKVSDSPTDDKMMEIWKSLHKTPTRKK